jgi:hypothetical protein
LDQTSNKIIQKGLAFARKQSGTDTVPSAETPGQDAGKFEDAETRQRLRHAEKLLKDAE